MCVAGVQSHANSLLVSKATFKPNPGIDSTSKKVE
jgi:hypothetical protein